MGSLSELAGWAIALGLLFGAGLCQGDATAAARVNAFGDRTEDLTRMAREVSAALSALEADGPAVRWRLERAAAPLRMPEHLDIFSPTVVRSSRVCRLCHAVAGAVMDAIRHRNKTGEELANSVVELCVVTNVVAPHICNGLVRGNTPVVEYVVKHTPDLDGATACGFLIQQCYDGAAAPRLEWALDRDMGIKPWARVRNAMIDVDPPTPTAPYRILQITDFHWDEDYDPDGSANCGEPICCRKGQGTAQRPEDRVGRWGDYRNCDVPWETVADLIRHVQDTLFDTLDIIYFTGDVVDHGVWATSRESNERKIRKTFTAMKAAFGDKPVMPIVGNHEPHPLNVFAPDYITNEDLSTRWLYELLAELWIDQTHWLPESTRRTILKGGFYTVLIKPGFRIITLNTMYCYTFNWWLLHDAVDPSGQLSWLIDILLMAEEANEKVHILSHIPPGSHDCLESWTREFSQIVDRFSATIASHFNGHTHNDDFVLFYDNHGRPNNVAFNGGSLTTHADVNPNYKLYLVDGNHNEASWHVIDAELWGFNITKANQPGGRPDWYRMYSFRDTFKVQSMHPVHLEMFVRRLTEDNELLQQYYRYHMLNSDVSYQTGCDDICAERLICNSVSPITNHREHCDRLLNKQKLNYSYFFYFFGCFKQEKWLLQKIRKHMQLLQKLKSNQNRITTNNLLQFFT